MAWHSGERSELRMTHEEVRQRKGSRNWDKIAMKEEDKGQTEAWGRKSLLLSGLSSPIASLKMDKQNCKPKVYPVRVK